MSAGPNPSDEPATGPDLAADVPPTELEQIVEEAGDDPRRDVIAGAPR